MFATILLLCILAFAIAVYVLNFRNARAIFKQFLILVAHFFVWLWSKIVIIAKWFYGVMCKFWRWLKSVFAKIFSKKEDEEQEDSDGADASATADESPKADKANKKKKKEKKNRLSKQFSRSRPVLLPPEESSSIKQNEEEAKSETKEDAAAGDNAPKALSAPRSIPSEENIDEMRETLRTPTSQTQPSMQYMPRQMMQQPQAPTRPPQAPNMQSQGAVAAQQQAPEQKKPLSMPSMQYRFSNKSFSKNQEDLSKKKSLQAELDEILKKAAEEPAMAQARNPYGPNASNFDNDFAAYARTHQPPQQSRNYPFMNSGMQTPSPYAQRSYYAPNQPPMPNAYANQRPTVPQNVNDVASIPIKDFDLNKLPDNIKRQIIAEYFLKNNRPN